MLELLTLEKALTAISAAEKKAKELEIAVTIVVVDSSGTVVATHRMDGAFSVSPKFATAKALTSGTLGLPTVEIAKYAQPGQPYYGVSSLDGGVFTTVAGGQPIKEGEKLIGGIGVGGSYDVSQDDQCAAAGAAAVV